MVTNNTKKIVDQSNMQTRGKETEVKNLIEVMNKGKTEFKDKS